MNLALRDIRHYLGRFVLTAIGLSLLFGVAEAMLGIYGGLVEEALTASEGLEEPGRHGRQRRVAAVGDRDLHPAIPGPPPSPLLHRRRLVKKRGRQRERSKRKWQFLPMPSNVLCRK